MITKISSNSSSNNNNNNNNNSSSSSSSVLRREGGGGRGAEVEVLVVKDMNPRVLLNAISTQKCS